MIDLESMVQRHHDAMRALAVRLQEQHDKAARELSECSEQYLRDLLNRYPPESPSGSTTTPSAP